MYAWSGALLIHHFSHTSSCSVVNVPLIVGVTIAAVVLLGSGGVIACVVCFLVFIRRRRHSVVATHIVSTTPVSAATTVVATNSNYQPAPVVMPVVQTGYPPQYQPQVRTVSHIT